MSLPCLKPPKSFLLHLGEILNSLLIAVCKARHDLAPPASQNSSPPPVPTIHYASATLALFLFLELFKVFLPVHIGCFSGMFSSLQSFTRLADASPFGLRSHIIP